MERSKQIGEGSGIGDGVKNCYVDMALPVAIRQGSRDEAV